MSSLIRVRECCVSLCGNRGCVASFAELTREDIFARKVLLRWDTDAAWVAGGAATQYQVNLEEPSTQPVAAAARWKPVASHVTNSIFTAVYTWWNFAPLSIIFQFKKAANVWFLVHVLAMLVGQYTELFETSMSPFSTGSLLVIMLVIVSIVDLFGELARRAGDYKVNHSKAQVVVVDAAGAATVVVKPWRALRVGDLIKLESADRSFKMLPADIALLASSKVGGVVNVETSGIDGETSLKTMRPNGDEGLQLCRSLQGIARGAAASEITWEKTAKNATAELRACIDYEVPNKSVETFQGSLLYSLESEGAGAARKQREVSLRGGKGGQLLLRGSSLMQTQWALGVVIFTGDDTKLRMNSRVPAAKYSAVNRVIDQTLIIVAMAEVAIVLASVIVMVIWNAYEVDPNPSVWWFLDISEQTTIFPTWLASLFTFQILYNYMIPISMYAMIEIVNSGQALMIGADKEMMTYDATKSAGDERTWAGVRTPALCAELGQVRFVFSDKTGTLTQNKMDLKFLSVADRSYVASLSSGLEEEDSAPACAATQLEPMAGLPRRTLLARAHALDSIERKMMLMLAISHEVEIQQDGAYSSASPDELAFVQRAKACGFNFNNFVDDESVREVVVTPPGPGSSTSETLRYHITHDNVFNSTRKRASVVFRDELDGNKYKCWAKGADTFMLSPARLRSGQSDAVREANAKLDLYGSQGLRTLVFCERVLSDAEWSAFSELHHRASKVVDEKERASMLADAAALVECEMDYVGCTALEDELMDDVQGTVECVRGAGIGLWVLTGDKLDTAKVIAQNARIVDRKTMEIVDINVINPSEELNKWRKQAADRAEAAGCAAPLETDPSSYVWQQERRLGLVSAEAANQWRAMDALDGSIALNKNMWDACIALSESFSELDAEKKKAIEKGADAEEIISLSLTVKVAREKLQSAKHVWNRDFVTRKLQSLVCVMGQTQPLTNAEVAEALRAFMQEEPGAFDGKGASLETLEDALAAKEESARGNFCKHLFDKLDANKDGFVTRAEIESYFSVNQGMGGGGGGGGESHDTDEVIIAKPDVALFVHGTALEYIITDKSTQRAAASGTCHGRAKDALNEADSDEVDLASMFLELGLRCKSVVACRVSPDQKAKVVQLVRDSLAAYYEKKRAAKAAKLLEQSSAAWRKAYRIADYLVTNIFCCTCFQERRMQPICLAIGDGANDVPMIQEAAIGVGISGKEGAQAANSADFSVSEFKHLKRLLLLHGRWNYRRSSKLVIYSFYKNMAVVICDSLFGFFCFFSGQSFWEITLYNQYNFIFTMCPIIAIGLWDKDVSEEIIMRLPHLYGSGRLKLDLNLKRMLQITLLAFVHSAVIVLIPLGCTFLNIEDANGLSGSGFWTVGTVSFAALLLIMTQRAAMMAYSWTWPLVASLAFSFFAFMGVGFLYSCTPLIYLLNDIITGISNPECVFCVQCCCLNACSLGPLSSFLPPPPPPLPLDTTWCSTRRGRFRRRTLLSSFAV